MVIALSANPMRGSAAVDGDLSTALPIEPGSPLAAQNRAGLN